MDLPTGDPRALVNAQMPQQLEKQRTLADLLRRQQPPPRSDLPPATVGVRG